MQDIREGVPAPAHVPPNDTERLAAVRRYDVLDTPADGSFDRITELAARLFDVPIALVTIVDHDRIWFKSRFGLDGVTEIPRDPGLCASAICNDEVYVVEAARTDPRTLANPLVAGEFGLQFYAAVQLRTFDGFNLGTLCLLDRAPRRMSAEESATLMTLGGIVMDELELRLGAMGAVARERALRDEAARLAHENERLYHREHRVAMAFQNAMLPQTFPSIDGIRFDAAYVPAGAESEIGGDWYDAFLVDRDNLVISVGDVAGHGLHAATLMGTLRQSLRAFALTESSPAALLDLLDDVLRREDGETIVTAFVGWIALGSKTFHYASAGHPPPLYHRPTGEVLELPGTGIPLGLRKAHDAADAMMTLDAGSTVLMYTDGLIESTRNILEGEARLKAAFADEVHAPHTAQALHERLLPDGSFDDVAIMTVAFD